MVPLHAVGGHAHATDYVLGVLLIAVPVGFYILLDRTGVLDALFEWALE